MKNVTYLDFVIKDRFRYPPLSLDDLPSTDCFSSTIVHLSIKVMGFEDCISLLDGRPSQLHTFIVVVHYIRRLTNDLEDKVKPNNKHFKENFSNELFERQNNQREISK